MFYKNKRYLKFLIILCFYPMFILYTNIFNTKEKTEEKLINNKKNKIEKEYMDKIENINFQAYNNNCFGSLIIGGGPAGLTAATYCSRFGIPTGVIMGQEPGGALMKTGVVENWPGILALEGKYIIDAAVKQSKHAGAIILYEFVTNIVVDCYPFKVITNKNIYYAFSIMIATGSTIKKLGCPGEEEYWGKGVSSCAICDALLHKGKSVIVVGGGDSACEEALQLVPHVDSVYLLVRGKIMRASQAMQEKVIKNKKINILYETELKKILGNKESVTNAILVNGEKEYFFNDKFPGKNLSGIFIAIGQLPNTNLVKDIVDIQPNGLIACQGRSQNTSFPGIFCGGDVSNHYKQAGIAAGEGTIAAIDMFNFLQNLKIDMNFYKENTKIWVENNNTNTCINGVCNLVLDKIEEKETLPPLNAEYKIQTIKTEKEYKKLIGINDNKYYLIDIFGSGCPACDVIKTTINQYIKKNPKLSIYLINYETLPSIQQIYSIKSIPTLLLIKNGKVISKRIGSMDLKEFQEWINKCTN